MTDDSQITSGAKEAKSGERLPESSKLNNAKEAAAKITVEKFASFKQKFEKELNSRHFGTDIRSVDDYSKSAGAKELEKTGAKEILLQEKVQRRLYKVLRNYVRLMKEQPKVRRVSAKLGSLIKTLRDAQTAIQNLQENITALDKRVKNILGWECRTHLQTAKKELTIVEARLCDIEETSASYIHPEIRRKHDKEVPKQTVYRLAKFKPLLSMFDYELDSLKKKGPEHWLWGELDSALRRRFRQANKKVSTITRCRIVASILRAAGQAPVDPSTIKEHLLQTTKAKKPTPASARNLPAT